MPVSVVLPAPLCNPPTRVTEPGGLPCMCVGVHSVFVRGFGDAGQTRSNGGGNQHRACSRTPGGEASSPLEPQHAATYVCVTSANSTRDERRETGVEGG